MKAAKRGALFGARISIGSNTVEVIRGDKEIGEAIVDVTIDTAIAGATGTASTGIAAASGAVTAATIAAAPIIAGGVIIGGITSFIGSLFDQIIK